MKKIGLSLVLLFALVSINAFAESSSPPGAQIVGATTTGHVMKSVGRGKIGDAGYDAVQTQITAGTPDIVASPTTGNVTISLTQPVTELGSATSHTILTSEMGTTLVHNSAAAVADALAQAGSTGFEAGKSFTLINIGDGAVTITPTISKINKATSLVVNTNQAAYFISRVGGDWAAFLGSSSFTVTSGTPALVISNPSTGNATFNLTNPVNYVGATTPYTVSLNDMSKQVIHNSGSAVTSVLASGNTTGFGQGAGYVETNIGAGALTVSTSAAGATINGASTITLQQWQSAAISSTTSGNYTALIGYVPGSGSAQTNVAQSWTAAQRCTPVVVSISGSTFTPDFSLGNCFEVTLVHASCPCTIANPTNQVDGQAGTLRVKQSSTGSDTIGTWGSNWKFPAGAAPAQSTGANKVDIYSTYTSNSLINTVLYGNDFR